MSVLAIHIQLGVSRQTIYNRRCELGILNYQWTQISDQDLDDLVSSKRLIFLLLVMAGSRGIFIQRDRLRDCIYRTDPALRWHQLVRRRPSLVQGPNALWHIDGSSFAGG